jgi:hypothetical protein
VAVERRERISEDMDCSGYRAKKRLSRFRLITSLFLSSYEKKEIVYRSELKWDIC